MSIGISNENNLSNDLTLGRKLYLTRTFFTAIPDVFMDQVMMHWRTLRARIVPEVTKVGFEVDDTYKALFSDNLNTFHE